MKTPLEHDLFQACLLELTEGHLALDRLGAPREIQQGDDIRECLIAERISGVAQGARITAAEIQSGTDRQKWAENLILQLPIEHNGRNSWLLNYGRGEFAQTLRKDRELLFNEQSQAVNPPALPSTDGGKVDGAYFTECNYPKCGCARFGRCENAVKDETAVTSTHRVSDGAIYAAVSRASMTDEEASALDTDVDAAVSCVLVPREPTPEMLRAGFLADEGCEMPGQIYRAMIDAYALPSTDGTKP